MIIERVDGGNNMVVSLAQSLANGNVALILAVTYYFRIEPWCFAPTVAWSGGHGMFASFSCLDPADYALSPPGSYRHQVPEAPIVDTVQVAGLRACGIQFQFQLVKRRADVVKQFGTGFWYRHGVDTSVAGSSRRYAVWSCPPWSDRRCSVRWNGRPVPDPGRTRVPSSACMPCPPS